MEAIKDQVNICIYKEDAYQLIALGEDLIGTYNLTDAICNGVLNINALYKNFIDDNFEHHAEVQEHDMPEIFLEKDVLLITMCALDKNSEVLQSHSITLELL